MWTSPPATVSPPAPPQAEDMAQPTAEPICAAPGYGYHLPAKPRSATDVWHAWHGLGPYENTKLLAGARCTQPTKEDTFLTGRQLQS